MKESTTPTLTRFNFDGHGQLTVLSWNGQPAWIAQEVAQVLKIERAARTLRQLKLAEGVDFQVIKGEELQRIFAKPEFGFANFQENSKTRHLTLIFESGLYALAFALPRKPEIVRFRDWVSREVLPALRTRGFYTMPGRVPYRDWNGICRLFDLASNGAAPAPSTLAWMGFTPQGDVPVEYRVTPPPMILSKLVALAREGNPYAVNYLGNVLHIPLPPDLQLDLPGVNV